MVSDDALVLAVVRSLWLGLGCHQKGIIVVGVLLLR